MKLLVLNCCEDDGFSIELGASLNCPVVRVDLTHFGSTGEMTVVAPNDVVGADVIIIGAIEPGGHEKLIEHVLTICAVKESGSSRITSLLPYLPYARSDQRLDPHGVLGIRVIVDILVAAGADRIITLDCHSHRTLSTLSLPVWNVDPYWMFRDAIEGLRTGHSFLVSMDFGGAERVQRLGRETRLSSVCFSKIRSSDTEVKVDLSEDVHVLREHAIIVDDAVYTASTLLAVCKRLRMLGVRSIDLIVTHIAIKKEYYQNILDCRINRIILCNACIPYTTDCEPFAASIETVSARSLVRGFASCFKE